MNSKDSPKDNGEHHCLADTSDIDLSGFHLNNPNAHLKAKLKEDGLSESLIEELLSSTSAKTPHSKKWNTLWVKIG